MPRKKKEEKNIVSETSKVKSNKVAEKASGKKKLKPSATAPKTVIDKNPLVEKPKRIKVVREKISKPPVSKRLKMSKVSLDTVEPINSTDSFNPLPHQGETRLVAFVRDPQCVFTYWEVTPTRLEEVKKELKDEFKNSYMVLRLFHVEPNGDRILFDEIRIEPEKMNHYVELKRAGSVYELEIGQKTLSGRYVTYARSNLVSTDSRALSLNLEKGEPSSQEEMSQALLNYYRAQGYDENLPLLAGKISSAENLKRLSRVNRSSFF